MPHGKSDSYRPMDSYKTPSTASTKRKVPVRGKSIKPVKPAKSRKPGY